MTTPPVMTPTVSRSIDIAADPATVYALVTDLDVLAELASETESMRWTKGSRAEPGSRFAGRNRNGRRSWTTTCTVTDARPGEAFGFDVRCSLPPVPVAHWRYEITATDGGCRVTESTVDQRPGWFRKPAELVTGVGDRTAASARHIEETLQRLRERAERG